jgi:hypothetical protein
MEKSCVQVNQPQSQRHPFRHHQGGGSLDCRNLFQIVFVSRKIKAQAADVAGRFEQLAGLQGPLPLCREKGLFGRGDLHETRTERGAWWAGAIAEFDAEGRYLELRFDTPGAQAVDHQLLLPERQSSGELRQLAKFRFLWLNFSRTWRALKQSRVHPVRRHEHRPPGRSI